MTKKTKQGTLKRGGEAYDAGEGISRPKRLTKSKKDQEQASERTSRRSVSKKPTESGDIAKPSKRGKKGSKKPQPIPEPDTEEQKVPDSSAEKQEASEASFNSASEASDIEGIYSDYKPRQSKRQAKGQPPRKKSSRMDEEKPQPKRMDEEQKSKRSTSTASSKYRRVQDLKKELNHSTFQEQEVESMKGMNSFFFSYLNDKNAAGLTVHSLLKYLKTNQIHNKEKKFDLDEDLTSRMIVHLKKKLGKDESGKKRDELVVTEEELLKYVVHQRKFHVNMMNKILKV